jgi:nodulation protein E
MTNAAASWTAMEFGVTGPTLCISTACASATQSIGLAMQMVRAGIVERCIAGGAEALLAAAVFRAWEVLRVMTPTLCRPFSQGRDGMMLGEGAAMLVLETEEAALARGAPILAEIAGYGTTSDAGDLLRPDPAGAAAAMAAAIADAGLAPADIGYVNAHGTGTVANEQSETEALRRVFGQDLAGLAVSSTKPIHGHALGAVGAIEMIVAINALRERIAPPTINFLGVDDKLGIDPVGNVARPFSGDAVMSNSFAFGGINASLVARRYAG